MILPLADARWRHTTWYPGVLRSTSNLKQFIENKLYEGHWLEKMLVTDINSQSMYVCNMEEIILLQNMYMYMYVISLLFFFSSTEQNQM